MIIVIKSTGSCFVDIDFEYMVKFFPPDYDSLVNLALNLTDLMSFDAFIAFSIIKLMSTEFICMTLTSPLKGPLYSDFQK